MSGLAPTTAHAQETDADSARTLGQAVAGTRIALGGPKQAGSPQSPVPLGNLKPSYSITDFVLKGTFGEVALTRHFSADNETWDVGEARQGMVTGAPFGGAPWSSQTPSWSPNTLYWWHNFFSYVDVRPTIRHIIDGQEDYVEPRWDVREPGGGALTFDPCPDGLTTPCTPFPGPHSTNSEVQLQWDGTGFVLYRRGVGRYLFRQHFSEEVDSGPPKVRDIYFLSEIQDMAGRTLATLTYAPGSPLVSEVVTPEGNRLRFHYEERARTSTGTETVLVWVGLVDVTGVETEAVRYDYRDDKAGLLAASRRPDGLGGYRDVVTYGYGDPAPYAPGTKWTVTAGGSFVEQILGWNATAIASDRDESGTRTISGQSLDPQHACSPGQLSFNVGPYACDYRQYQRLNRGFSTFGAGTTGSVNLQHEYLVELTDQGPAVRSRTDRCTGASCGDAQQRSWAWEWTSFGALGELIPVWQQGPKGDYTRYAYATGPAGNPELMSVYTGAQTPDGGGALSRIDYTYVNGSSTSAFVERLLQSESRPSVMAPGEEATTYYRYDAKNRLAAKFSVGYTRKLQGDGWVTVPRTIGTFFFTHYECAGDTTEDELGRVVEVHGPCEVGGTGATDCNEGEPVSVTQMQYYPGDESNDAHRLHNVRVYSDGTVNGCGTHALETTYADYDARGRARQSVDPNGTITRFTYDGDRLVQSQRGDSVASMLTTDYGYDDEAQRQLWVRPPSGEYDVTCYREGTTPQSGCVGGTVSSRLQWTAKSLSPTGASFSSAVKYTYVDGRLSRQETIDGLGQVHAQHRYDSDAFGRPTFEATGDAATQRAFDAADHLSKLGLPYNGAPAFCRTEDNYYRPCAEIDRDRLGRLTEMREYATKTAGSKASSCVSYDAQGHLARWVSGCTTSCDVCLADDTAAAAYTHDDFGQLVEVSAPWLQSQMLTTKTPGGAVTMEYDALGHMVRKQLPSQTAMGRYEAYAYDTLGRLTQAQVISRAGVELLQSNVYGDVASDSECAPYQDPATAHLYGHIASRVDGGGKTCFSYDQNGQITRAARVVHASEHVNALTRHIGATTEQYFDPAGRLTSLRYPDGRMVHYDYWTDWSNQELINAIKSISVDVRKPDGTIEVTPVVQNIHWEPSGALRSYELVVAPGGQNVLVEYLRGSGGSVDSSATCAMARPSGADGTGRVEGLWVSRPGGDWGPGTGDVYRARYGWSADQVVAQAECVLSTSAAQPARVVTYAGSANARGYDATLQLTHTRETRGASGQVVQNDFTYDRRGNRTDSVESNNSFGYLYSAVGDQLILRSFQPAPPWDEGDEPTFGGKAHWYSDDGICNRVQWSGVDDYISNQGHPNYGNFDYEDVYLGYGNSPGRSPTYVYATTNVDQPVMEYQYRYDATGHRVQKEYLWTTENAVDELYWNESMLLEDRGNAQMTYATTDPRTVPVDQYIWLAGRPVVMIKSEAQVGSIEAPSLSPREDLVGTCTRNGEPSRCGIYFMINDPTGRPVVMLDRWGNVTGTGEYTTFGHVNREDRQLGTAHPLLEWRDDMGSLAVSEVPGLVTEVRARLPYVDIGDLGWLAAEDSGGNIMNWWEIPANHGGGPLVTSWVHQPGSGLRLAAYAGAWDGIEPLYGAALDSVEYRRHEPGVVPVWTRLRMPGQYYDPETDLVDNWHRVYDPSSGRFLAPDPKLLSPKYVAGTLAAGRVPRVYAYANNNPIAFTDPTGLSAEEDLANAKAALEALKGKLAKVTAELDALSKRSKMFGNNQSGKAWDEMAKAGQELLAAEDALKAEVDAGQAAVAKLEAKLDRMKSLAVHEGGGAGPKAAAAGEAAGSAVAKGIKGPLKLLASGDTIAVWVAEKYLEAQGLPGPIEGFDRLNWGKMFDSMFDGKPSQIPLPSEHSCEPNNCWF